MPVWSAQGGNILTPESWSSQNVGYLFGRDCEDHEHYKLAREYVQEKHFCDEGQFDHSYDCFYLENNCHIELRGGHRYLRPSICAKLVFKNSMSVFNDANWLYSYHGTNPQDVKSILQHGLTYPGYSKGVKVTAVHGGAYGQGVYTSKLPLYAQLYAKCESWRGKYVQVILLVRQHPDSVGVYRGGCESNDGGNSGGGEGSYGSQGRYTAAMIGRTDIHRLYGGRIDEDEVQFVTQKVEDNNMIQALLIKIHDIHPAQPGGEYYAVEGILKRLP